jgi:CHAT domain-containing protein/tetratricopeptide (TPR) repeat protein
MITIDGLADDWLDYRPLITDDRGDGNPVDVKSAYGLTNDHYFYLMIETYGDIGRYSHVNVSFDFEGDGEREYWISFTPFLGLGTASLWGGYAYLARPDGKEPTRLLGTLSAQYRVIEFKMPLEFIEDRQDFYVMVDFGDMSTGAYRGIEDTSWGHVTQAEEREPEEGERTDKMRSSVLIAEGKGLDMDASYRALQKFEAALAIYEGIGDRIGEANACRQIAELSSAWLGNPQQSLAYSQRAYEIYHDLGLRDLESDVALQIGGILLRGTLGIGDIAQARDYLHAALEIKRSLGDPIGEATCYRALGSFHRAIGDFQQALALYQQALAIYRDLGDKRGEADIALAIGGLYEDLGDYSTTEKYWQKWLEIRREIEGRAGELWGSNQLAVLYWEMGDYNRALELGLKVIELCDEAYGGECGIGNFYSNLGMYYAGLGDYDAAVQNIGTALEITRRTGYRTGQALAYYDLADVHAKMENTQKALQDYQQALNIYQEIDARSQQADVRLEIGSLYGDLGQYDEALAYQLEALKGFQAIGEAGGEITAHQQIGETYRTRGDLEVALAHYQQAIAIVEGLRGYLTIEEFKGQLSELFADVYEGAVLVQLELDRPQDAFAYVERARARAFLDQLGNHRVDPREGADPTLIEQEQQLSGEITALAHLVQEEYAKPSAQRSNELVRETQSRLNEKRAEYADLLVQLKLSNPAYAALVSVDPLSLEEIQSEVLGEDVTLVEYFVAEDQTIIFVLTSDSFQAIPIPIARETLTNRVSAFRDLVGLEAQQPDERLTRDRLAAAQALFNTLLKPLSPHFSRHTLVIVPHSVLHYLPFAALADEEGRPLAVRYTLSFAPSASALSYAQANRNPDQGRLLALGNPTTDLSPLAFAESEVQAISTFYASHSTLLGPEANEAAFRAAAPSADRIHLAVHGQFNPVSPLFSTLHLAGEPTADDSTGPVLSPVEGLTPRTALTSDADGRLEVHEIYGLDLREANLVVLSACQTKLGELSRGDELVGLTRAFLYAGTPTVVATLWEVDDEATGVLMAAFHRHLREGMGPAAALRAAQEEVRANEEWSAAYYWAGVQVIGDGGETREETVTPMTVTPETAVESVTEEAGHGEKWVLWIAEAVVGLGMACVALIFIRRRVRNS